METIESYDKVIEFKELNNQISNIITDKISIAKQYFELRYPQFQIGDIVYDNVYKCIREVTNKTVYYDHYRFTRDYYDPKDNFYHYNTPLNQIEKEFKFHIHTVKINSNGYSKAKWNDTLHLNSIDDNIYTKICNKNDIPTLLQQYGIKAKTINSINLIRIKNAIERNNI